MRSPLFPGKYDSGKRTVSTCQQPLFALHAPVFDPNRKEKNTRLLCRFQLEKPADWTRQASDKVY